MDNEHDMLKFLVNDGAFGPVTYVSSKLDNEVDKGTQFASVVSFLVLIVNNGFEDLEIHVVLKRQHVSNEAKDMFNSDIAFKNEVIMYTKILPLLQAESLNLFPKLYCTNQMDSMRCDQQQILTFENLQHCGYMLTKEKIFIDYEHVKIALMKLGQFHGLSYLAKRHHKDTFFKITNELIETKFTKILPEFKEMMRTCMLRGIKPLMEQNKETDILNRVLRKLENLTEVAQLLVKPEEPFSVICHGDFCRNNMFFKYDNSNPSETKFFDLQNSLYTSPAIDTSFFLYMNTTTEMRDKYWDKFLNIYWESFSNTVPNLEFTFAQFMEHFAKRAVYGYLPTCFFLPMSMDIEDMDVEEFSKLPEEVKQRRMLTCAGNAGTKAITDIVEHLLSKHYLHKFLEL
uniref:Putative juvenile hormone-inducible protein n=1 Tax=Panstrongylus lignarius TaxID=156445 RepID=A0A224XRG1_9HEMI